MPNHLILFCCECNEDTIHVIAVGTVFTDAVMCIRCETIWEAENTPES